MQAARGLVNLHMFYKSRRALLVNAQRSPWRPWWTARHHPVECREICQVDAFSACNMPR